MFRTAVFIVMVAAASVMAAPAVSAEDAGCMRFSFDTLPFLGDSDKDKESDEAPAEEEGRPSSERYTYDATGRRVPVRTE